VATLIMLLRTWENIVIEALINLMRRTQYDRLSQQQLGFLL